jgi:hypothetical protein
VARAQTFARDAAIQAVQRPRRFHGVAG